MRTYKTNDPEVREALQQRADAVKELRKRGNLFREHFGAANLVNRNTVSGGFHIVGLVFDPPKDTTLWTKPDRQALGSQQPRSKVTHGSPQQRERLAALRVEWERWMPQERVSWDPVVYLLGTDPGTVFLAGLGLFELGDTVYIKTGATLGRRCREILASEYEAAEAEHAAEKVAKAARGES